MLREKIKPIPQYLLKKIKKIDKHRNSTPNGFTRFYSYLTKNDGELVKVTVAVRDYKDQWLCKQVAVHGLDSDHCFVKDLVFHYIGGYSVGWHDMGVKKEKWFEDGHWYIGEDNKFDPSSILLNKDYLDKFPEFKYSVYELYQGCDIIKYLRLYEEFPQVEYLMKMGLACIHDSKQILRKLKKDVKFRKWIAKHRGDIGYHTYVSAILRAYSNNIPIDEAEVYEWNKKVLTTSDEWKELKVHFKDDVSTLLTYLSKQIVPIKHYFDYIKACLKLDLDITIPKHRYPHDFQRWHDIRIDEYASKKAEIDAKERKALYDKFAAIAKKYQSLQRNKEDYVVVIATSPAELIKEGETLHHCVGRMGYDQKFAREESLIFFVREKDKLDTPFVTMEYSVARHTVVQCYGENNRRPNESVMQFVNEKWLPYANRKIQKLAA